MITIEDLQNVISYGEHTALLTLEDKEDKLHSSFVEITDDLFDADYFYIYKESQNPIVYQLLFLTLLEELKPANGVTDDKYDTLKMMKKAKLGFIMYWKIGKTKKYLLLL